MRSNCRKKVRLGIAPEAPLQFPEVLLNCQSAASILEYPGTSDSQRILQYCRSKLPVVSAMVPSDGNTWISV